jgi:hypothetical protein
MKQWWTDSGHGSQTLQHPSYHHSMGCTQRNARVFDNIQQQCEVLELVQWIKKWHYSTNQCQSIFGFRIETQTTKDCTGKKSIISALSFHQNTAQCITCMGHNYSLSRKLLVTPKSSVFKSHISIRPVRRNYSLSRKLLIYPTILCLHL